MKPGSAQRLLALAAVALLAAVAALALASSRGSGSSRAKRLPKPASTWYPALAAPAPAGRVGRRTACGVKLSPRTMGVAHPLLPCGVKIYIAFGKTRVLTEVIDRGPYVPGREFDLTRPLADRIGLHGTQPIRWTYAR